MENEKKAPNKWLIAGAAILGVLLLGNLINGDDASAPTETVTVEASPSKSPTQESNSGGSSSSASVEDEFIMYMTVVDTPSWMLEGEALDILVTQAKTVCGYIGDGDSKSDIIWIITLAAEQSNSSQEIIDAFLAAAVAGTYTYCPQYEGFWD
jgi:hypothetical protein